MSRFQMIVSSPKDIEFELRATLKLSEWKEILEAINSDALYGPTGWLRAALSEMISKANRDYRAWPEDDEVKG